MKSFQLGLTSALGLACVSASWNIPDVCHNKSTLSTVLKPIFSFMSLSEASIIFESELTSFCWYQRNFIDSFPSMAFLFKFVEIHVTLLPGISLFKIEQAIGLP